MEKKKEEVKALNSSLESTRLELSSFLLEAQLKANLAKKLQEEREVQAQLEELKRLIREWETPYTFDMSEEANFSLKKDTNT